MQYLRYLLIFTIMLLASVSQGAASAAAFDAPAVSDLELDPRERRVFLVRGITSRLLSGSLNKLRSAPNPYAILKQWVTVKARDALKDRIINPENISLQVGSIELKNDGDVMDNVQLESMVFVGIRGSKRAAEAVPAAAAAAGAGGSSAIAGPMAGAGAATSSPVQASTTVADIWRMTERDQSTAWRPTEWDSKAIRTSLADYESAHTVHKLMLGAGQKQNPHGHTDTSTDQRFPGWYTADLLLDGDCKPDVVLDVFTSELMNYFPDNWADEVAVDEPRILDQKSVPSILRILKPGKQFMYPLGANGVYEFMRPDDSLKGDDHFFFEDGHNAVGGPGAVRRFREDEAFRNTIYQEALAEAKKFYMPKGASDVTLDTRAVPGASFARVVFVITKK